jgi:hypothetical protein
MKFFFFKIDFYLFLIKTLKQTTSNMSSNYDIINNINRSILNIYNKSIKDDFINLINNEYISDDTTLNMDDDDISEYLIDKSEDVFNGISDNETNILEQHNIDYTINLKIFIHMLKYIKGTLIDEMEHFDMFCNMFDEGISETENRVINMYVREVIHSDRYGNLSYLNEKLLNNIGKYNSHKKKHNKLINLYEKLDIKNKQKKTINKILNNKFDTDILENILDCY